MKTRIHPSAPLHSPVARRGLTLLEALFYLTLLCLIMALSYECYYRTEETVRRMNRNCEDIMTAQHAGELWRRHMRNASAPVAVGTDPTAQEFFVTIPGTNGLTRYSFREESVWIRTPEDEADRPLIRRVLKSSWVEDNGTDSVGWRWELELKPIRRDAQIRPLFTFLTIHRPGSAP